MAEIERIEVTPASRPRRTVDERVFIRWPGLLRGIYRHLSTRDSGSRLRRAVLVKSQLAGWEAQNREDWDVNLMAFHPEYEFTFEGDAPKMGIDIGARHIGRDDVEAMMTTWRDAFDGLRFEPREVLDPGGDRFGVRVVQFGRGRTTGIDVSQELWSVYWLRDGLIARQTVFYEEAPALEALAAGSNGGGAGTRAGSGSLP